MRVTVSRRSERSYYVEARPGTARRMRVGERPPPDDWLQGNQQSKPNATFTARVASANDKKVIQREQVGYTETHFDTNF